MTNWLTLGVVAGAGAIGAVTRWVITLLFKNTAGTVRDGIALPPWGTSVVNLIGCLLFGVAFSWLERKTEISSTVRAAILVGFLGSFTTFSTYIFETVHLIERELYALALGTFALQNVGGFALLMLGLYLGRLQLS